jgi:hypothetical protein
VRTTSVKRLEKVEAGLSPREVFLVWMQEAHQHGSLGRFVDSLKDAPDEAYPLWRLPDQVERAVRAALKGGKEAEVRPTVRRAVTEVVFYLKLHSELNTRLMNGWRAMFLQFAYALSELRHLIGTKDPTDEDVEKAGRLLIEASVEFRLWDEVARWAAERYFRGCSPLFPALQEQLREALEDVQQATELFDEHVEAIYELRELTRRKGDSEKGAAGPALEAVQIRGATIDLAPSVKEMASHMVAMARAEAAVFMGEQALAVGIIRRRIWTEGD